MRFVVEIILIAIILMCAWNGYKKGLVMGIGGILAIVLSLYVGDLLSDTFSGEATPVLRPFVSGYMDGTEGIIGDTMSELLGVSNLDVSIQDAIEQNPEMQYELAEKSFMKMGVYSKTAKAMSIETAALADKSGAPLPSAIVDIMCEKLVYYIGFILFFIITLIILTVIGNVFNLSFKIPEMDKLNNIGGVVAGVITGIMFCIIIVWFFKFSGRFLPEAEMTRTLLTRLFIKMDILSAFLSV